MKRFLTIAICLLCGQIAAAQENLREGKMYYEMARENGHPDYYRIALSKLQAAAKEGYGEACYLLGGMYRYGQGIEKNYSIAVRMYQRALEFGYGRGEAELGQMYEHGYGVPKDPAKALALYKKSAAAGDLWGKTLLGACYYYGLLDCPQDYIQAFLLFKEAEKTYLYAKQMVGECYEYGRGVGRDEKQAASCYESSRQPNALYRAAVLRKNFGDSRYASNLMVQAIKAGYEGADAYYYAGLWLDEYRASSGTHPDYYMYDSESPLKLMTKAADMEYAPAQKTLGDWYQAGLYVAVNLPKAREWHAKAKANGIEKWEEQERIKEEQLRIEAEKRAAEEKAEKERIAAEKRAAEERKEKERQLAAEKRRQAKLAAAARYEEGDLYEEGGEKGVVVKRGEQGLLIVKMNDMFGSWPGYYAEGDGWRLPTRSELSYIQSNRDLVNRYLDAHGGSRIRTGVYYWSSSGSSNLKIASNGYEISRDQSNKNYIRLVREF